MFNIYYSITSNKFHLIFILKNQTELSQLERLRRLERLGIKNWKGLELEVKD